MSNKKLRYRAEKKTQAVYNLSRMIHNLRDKVGRDITSDNERKRVLALIVRIIDRTSARVGNLGSAQSGHFGITTLQCRHVTVSGNTVRLRYTGKSGVLHDKSFSDYGAARLVRELKRNCHRQSDWLFRVNGQRVTDNAVNDYLSYYGITSKDIRGHHSNRYLVTALRRYSGMLKGEKMRKKAFLAEVRKVAARVGHLPATLRGHYLLPGFETNYVKHGRLPRIK